MRCRARARARWIASRSPRPGRAPDLREGPMSESATESAVREFLLREVLDDRDLQTLAPDHNLIESGLLDSLGILKTVEFCQAHFGITIPDRDVVPDHMESVRAIAALVERMRAKS